MGFLSVLRSLRLPLLDVAVFDLVATALPLGLLFAWSGRVHWWRSLLLALIVGVGSHWYLGVSTGLTDNVTRFRLNTWGFWVVLFLTTVGLLPVAVLQKLWV
jgi:hypothetical protein